LGSYRYRLRLNRAPVLEIMEYWTNNFGTIIGGDEESNKRLKPLAASLLPLLFLSLVRSKSFRDDIADDARKAKLAAAARDSQKTIGA